MKLSTASKFTYRLGTALRAGADLVRSLQSEAHLGPARHRAAMQELVEGVKRGESLSEVMSRESYFPKLMTSMTRVGEETGKLERSLLTLSEHYQHQITTRRWFLISIAWPMVQLALAVLVLSLLIWLMGILTPAGGGQMPDLLGFGLRGTSGVLWFWFYLALILGAIALVIWGYFRNIAGVQNLVPLVYKIPVIGSSIQTITISRFCWTLSLALGAGLDPIRSMALSLDSTDSDFYRSAAKDGEAAIRDGASLAGAIESTGIFPEDFVQRVDIAEHSGTDAESMEHLSEEYDQRAKQAIKVITGFLTLLIWLSVMGIIIFFIFRLASIYFGALNSASEPIVPERFGN